MKEKVITVAQKGRWLLVASTIPHGLFKFAMAAAAINLDAHGDQIIAQFEQVPALENYGHLLENLMKIFPAWLVAIGFILYGLGNFSFVILLATKSERRFIEAVDRNWKQVKSLL